MGIYINGYLDKKVEVKGKSRWVEVEGGLTFFDFQSSIIYAWMSGIGNDACIPPLESGRTTTRYKDDFGGLFDGWTLSVDQLLNFDYDQVVEDRSSCGPDGVTEEDWVSFKTLKKGKGAVATYREHFGEEWFERLAFLKQTGAERLVFWFD